MFIIAFIMILMVVFVNGSTDAANAIATAVGTGAIEMKKASILSAVMNFAGVCIACAFRPAVSDFLVELFFISTEMNVMLNYIITSMMTVFIWAVTAWYFGIPTSESHALIASLSGCAVALCGSLEAFNKVAMMRALFGMFYSVFIGFAFAFALQKIFKRYKKIKSVYFQITVAGFLSFLHGAQDGQKFLAIFMMLYSALGETAYQNNRLLLVFCCALAMGLGTALGGQRIVQSVGENILSLSDSQGLLADISSCIGMSACTYFGYPVSTTHIRTMSIVGVGLATRENSLNAKLIKDMLLTWLFTFPACFFIGYIILKLFLVLT